VLNFCRVLGFRHLIVASLLLAMSGCAPDGPASLSACDFGLYWADCGGNSAPAIGCDQTVGDCRWFAGGTAVQGYVVSDCPASEPCCHDNWPFSEFAPSGTAREKAVSQLSLLSRGVIARESDSEVVVQFDLTEETTPGRISCSPSLNCSTGGGWARVVSVGRSVVVTVPRFEGRWELEIVIGDTAESWSARLYRYDETNHDSGPHLGCHDYWSFGREWTLVGQLHLNGSDVTDIEELHGRFEGRATDTANFEALEISIEF